MKGTRVIQFTLDSPKAQAKGWAVRPRSSKTNSKKKGAKKKRLEKREMFSAETLERLKQVNQ